MRLSKKDYLKAVSYYKKAFQLNYTKINFSIDQLEVYIKLLYSLDNTISLYKSSYTNLKKNDNIIIAIRYERQNLYVENLYLKKTFLFAPSFLYKKSFFFF